MEEKRLTQWTKNGASLILDNPQNAEEARAQLMEKFKLACNKLAELENKIEQGTLIELPCKVGDTVYVIVKKVTYGYPDPVMVHEIHEEYFNFSHLDIFGKYVFLTREEAEKR